MDENKMTTTPANLHTCPVDELYQACIAADELDQPILLDVLMERFGNADGWAWMVNGKKWPRLSCDAVLYFWANPAAVCLNCCVASAVALKLNSECVAEVLYYYLTISAALLDCARAAQEAIDAKEITL